jgi:hypothetical protein
MKRSNQKRAVQASEAKPSRAVSPLTHRSVEKGSADQVKGGIMEADGMSDILRHR